jgi:drug/metabolite transporter (DMT)-like permease
MAASLVTPLARGVVVGGVDPLGMLVVRLAITVVLLVISFGVVSPRFARVDRRGLTRLLVIGLISGVEIGCFFSALTYIDASTTAVIKSTQPLVVLLLLTVGGERLTGHRLLRVALSMAGIYLLVGVGRSVAPVGLIFLGLSLLLYALQLVMTQWWLPGYDPRTVTLYVTTLMALVVTVWWLGRGAPWSDPGLWGWLAIGVMAVVSTYFARIALYAAIARLGSGQVALLWPLQTLGVIVLSVLFLNERFTPIQWAGGGLVLLSALMARPRARIPLPGR